METTLQTLNFKGRQVRMVIREGLPWWVAVDVCAVLELESVHKVMERLDSDERNLIPVIDAMGRSQLTWCVNEPGIYTLVLGSRKPEAKEFKRWVVHDVLPSLRKDGFYVVTVDTPKQKFAVMRRMIDALEEHETRIGVLERRVDLIGADTHYRTVRAYCNEHGLRLLGTRAKQIGVRASALCRQRGIEIGEVPDERYGCVHSYPIEIIEEASVS